MGDCSIADGMTQSSAGLIRIGFMCKKWAGYPTDFLPVFYKKASNAKSHLMLLI